jgi:hypothetical protein
LLCFLLCTSEGLDDIFGKRDQHCIDAFKGQHIYLRFLFWGSKFFLLAPSWFGQADADELDEDVGCIDRQCKLNVQIPCTYVDFSLLDFFPDSPVISHISKIDPLFIVDVDVNALDCFEPFEFMQAQIDSFELVSRIQFDDVA